MGDAAAARGCPLKGSCSPITSRMLYWRARGAQHIGRVPDSLVEAVIGKMLAVLEVEF